MSFLWLAAGRFMLDKRFFCIYNEEHSEAINQANTMTRRVDCGMLQREGHMLEALYQETVEDYL